MVMPNIRKPTAIKELTGNPGKRALNSNEPQPVGRASPPEYMTTIGQIIWKRIVASMPEAVYTAADSQLLAAYCEAAAMWTEATRYFSQGGAHLTKGSTGQEVVSPWVRIQGDAARQMVQLGAKLGLSPADRQNLTITEDESEVNPFEFN